MRILTALRRAAALPAVVALVAALGGAPAASADTSGQADARVAQLLAQVRDLQQRVAAAEHAYDQALGSVASSVTAYLQDGRAADELATQVAAAQTQLDDRARGLYMSGGPLALWASLLDAHDVGTLQEQAELVKTVVVSDRALLAATAAVQGRVAAAADRAHARATRHIATERSVARQAASVATLLAQEQALLAQAQTHAAQVRAAEERLAAEQAAFSTITDAQLAALRVLPGSPEYMALYHRAAGTCAGLSWTVLAAIGQVESGHGRDVSTSYAGAMGPMQFLPATFRAYAVDGDGDGRADIMDAADAIFTAAHYLCANGAGRGPGALSAAIFHYNHADWYVQMVLTLAQQYADASA